MPGEQKSEQATPRRLDKARKEGQFPAARQLVSALQFCAFVAVLGKWSASWLASGVEITRAVVNRAFGPDLGPAEFVKLTRDLAWSCLLPFAVFGAALVALTVAAQLAATNLGFSWKKLAPDPKRLSPLAKLKELPSQNLPTFFQALIVLPLAGGAVYTMVRDNVDSYLSLPMQSLPSAVGQVGTSIQDLLWRAAYVFVAFGCVDLLRQRLRHQKTLRMTKHEVREELKETEGNPQIKARVRRLQRDHARKRMMQAIPKATAVIVNPTHYAVAIQYQPESMRAPRVVAKGKNFVAMRIKERAIEHLIPIVENPPLAQALYKSVEIGHEIPAELYRAVAEILAYIYKIMSRHAPRGAQREA